MEKNQDPPQWSTTKGHRVEQESCSGNLSSIQKNPVTQATGVLEAPAQKSSSENPILRRRTTPRFEDNPNNAVSNSEHSQLPTEEEEKEHKNIKAVVKVGTQCMPSDLGNGEDVDHANREIEFGQHPDLQAFTTEGAHKKDHINSEEVDNLVQEDKKMGHQKNSRRKIVITVVIVVLMIMIMMVYITQHYFSSASDVGLSDKDFQIGDILVIQRFWGLYEHFMIITSNTSVVHLTGGTNDWAKLMKGAVKEEELDVSNFVKDKNVRIESGAWEGKEPLLANEIIERAGSQIGEGGYHLLFYNCEHFARWCRYGESESYQAKWLSHLIKYMFRGICLSALFVLVVYIVILLCRKLREFRNSYVLDIKHLDLTNGKVM